MVVVSFLLESGADLNAKGTEVSSNPFPQCPQSVFETRGGLRWRMLQPMDTSRLCSCCYRKGRTRCGTARCSTRDSQDGCAELDCSPRRIHVWKNRYHACPYSRWSGC